MKALRIFVFAVLSQGLGAITGLLLAHWLSVGDYAIYTVTGAIVGAMSIVTKGGIHFGLNAILGRTWPDRERAAQATRAALAQRKRISAFLLPPLLIVAGVLMYRNHASLALIAALLLTLLAMWYFDMQSRVVDQVLLFANRAPALQALDAGLSGARLLLSWGVYLLGLQSALAASLVNTLFAGLRVPFVRRWLRRELPAQAAEPVAEDQRSIRAITRRQVPMDAFFCLQSQFAFAIVAFYGAVSQTAAIGALSRIGQLLVPVSIVVGAYVVPRFAQAREHVLRQYLGWLLLGSLPAGTLVLLAWLWPELLLRLVGANYAGLTSELLIACLGAGAYSIAGVAWELLANRGLNHFNYMQVPVVIAWCLAAPHLLDLSTLRGVLWFEAGLASGLGIAVLCELAGAIRAGRLLPPPVLSVDGGRP
ncbi:Conserved hypothetical protein; putative membrane protein [Cupriavidus taiwanensis]|uniref:Polysaccharide biosynthesis protein n=1 Tax=Cupriavidus taiwanensis TaxID=164546 RepID=A0A375E9B6_9BURK|nr:hypothetical protein [Cupriavidus taiwanensis]SOZ17539.1 Conserved hypothetical protein; putative membrane protein [Cupriavidus taiwanensis]SOZ29904.1 Conserved hypothetical protein; putative membrane protein [Cupriavidus taiwanensis]SOZ46990.1 Conserved hypothetical protein; putative membrane protein [Cupriavidus taiwanensis]SOZ65754.1 Conserved hypothetical protein; putative membrane protein [Cupriavidus taiwanensis]SOZ68274.1 Conserved hypothetical protein; putative membrane protein [Cup